MTATLLTNYTLPEDIEALFVEIVMGKIKQLFCCSYNPHKSIITSAQLGGGERHSLPFFENRKNCPDFGEKSPDCVHLWVKFSIQNAVLRVSRRKKSQSCPRGAFFSCVFDEMFTQVS